jgi:predicted lysophospholipase L1 biosynthesis ABC-type transport system permease subunit
MMRMTGRWAMRLATGGLVAAAFILWMMALMRPYADNQRNWLVLLGTACLAAAVVVAVAGSMASRRGARARLRAGAHRLASEWRQR